MEVMTSESFKEMIRKKILDLKSDVKGFYTETYNLVSVIVSLSLTEASPELDLIVDRMRIIYKCPNNKFKLTLPHLESLYFKFQDDPNLKIKGLRLDIYDIKMILDKARRDMLFYLALVEDRPKNYNIILEKVGPKGA